MTKKEIGDMVGDIVNNMFNDNYPVIRAAFSGKAFNSESALDIIYDIITISAQVAVLSSLEATKRVYGLANNDQNQTE